MSNKCTLKVPQVTLSLTFSTVHTTQGKQRNTSRRATLTPGSSGRLPYTIAKSQGDYPAQIDTDSSIFTTIQIPYNEKLAVDYRHFDAVSPCILTAEFDQG